MNADELRSGQAALDIRVWENEGGAVARPDIGDHYGRRVELNGTSTIYRFLTGVPAVMGDRAMSGLDETDATATMLQLNRRKLQRRKTAHSKSAFSTRI